MADETARSASKALLIVLLAASCSQALAGKVYRCGNVFQDQPCPEVKVATNQTPPTAPTTNGCATVKGGPATGDKGCVARASREASQTAQAGDK